MIAHNLYCPWKLLFFFLDLKTDTQFLLPQSKDQVSNWVKSPFSILVLCLYVLKSCCIFVFVWPQPILCNLNTVPITTKFWFRVWVASLLLFMLNYKWKNWWILSFHSLILVKFKLGWHHFYTSRFMFLYNIICKGGHHLCLMYTFSIFLPICSEILVLIMM